MTLDHVGGSGRVLKPVLKGVLAGFGDRVEALVGPVGLCDFTFSGVTVIGQTSEFGVHLAAGGTGVKERNALVGQVLQVVAGHLAETEEPENQIAGLRK